MIRHIVLLRAEKPVEASLDKLKAFCQSFDGLLCFNVSDNQSIEPHVMKGFSHGFVIDFADRTSRDRYVHDKEHQAIGAEIVACCKGDLDGIIVFDMPLEAS